MDIGVLFDAVSASSLQEATSTVTALFAKESQNALQLLTRTGNRVYCNVKAASDFEDESEKCASRRIYNVASEIVTLPVPHCSCADFAITVLQKRSSPVCAHIIIALLFETALNEQNTRV